ncbi:MAG: hypothetical protein D6702_11715 [Planctomycetota bacterium]|nr:MAG: hypothetical protein D6702_11715 [Planctomycetota bacterium]
MSPRLIEAAPTGPAAQFVVHEEGLADTFFLSLLAPAENDEGLRHGDLLAVSARPDAEPGDLVVWWLGTAESQALARLGGDLRLHPVAGFPPPPDGDAPRSLPPGARARLRGVVVGRLRSAGAAGRRAG